MDVFRQVASNSIDETNMQPPTETHEEKQSWNFAESFVQLRQWEKLVVDLAEVTVTEESVKSVKKILGDIAAKLKCNPFC